MFVIIFQASVYTNLWMNTDTSYTKIDKKKMFKLFLIFMILHFSCGSVIKRSTDSFVVKNATQTESPWLALITILPNNLRCGGSLVKDKFIITAAHCFNGKDLNSPKLKNEIKIRLGDWKTETDPDCEHDDDSCDRVAEIPLKKVIRHNEYRETARDKLKYDIAIIQLKWAPRKSELINNIDFTDRECNHKYDGEELSMTGFGYTPTSGSEYTKIKKSIQMTIQNDTYCGNSFVGIYNRDYHMCGTGTDGESTCSGDSGSGVTGLKNGIPMLDGIVAYGAPQCMDRDKPSGFVKVACHNQWINDTFKKLLGPKKKN
ncbi:trypsin-like [Chironomus tepperi]|uniref:trypsin-like n=1 Tax=Chironomus tepperi TaxID=113505 RepID=UPI00391F9C7E